MSNCCSLVFLRRWAKRIIVAYIGFILLFTCPNISLTDEKDVDYYICKTGDGMHDLMIDSPLYPLWTKVIDPSVLFIREKGYPILKKASKRIEKKFSPVWKRTSAEGQVYFEAAQEKAAELHKLHLAPTIQNLQAESQKIYQQYKPTLDKHSSNIGTLYNENMKPHVTKLASTVQHLLKTKAPKSVYDKIEEIELFFSNEFSPSRTTLPTKFHALMKHNILPVFYQKLNIVFKHAEDLYHTSEKSFSESGAGAFYSEKRQAFDDIKKNPESFVHKFSNKIASLYESTSNLISEQIEEFLSDPADMGGEELKREAFFNESPSKKATPTPKASDKASDKPAASQKKTKPVKPSGTETVETAASSAAPTETPKVAVPPKAKAKQEKVPSDNKIPKAEKKSAETPKAEKKPAGTPKVEKKSTETPKAEKKPAEAPKAEKKPSSETPKVKAKKAKTEEKSDESSEDKAANKESAPKVKADSQDKAKVTPPPKKAASANQVKQADEKKDTSGDSQPKVLKDSESQPKKAEKAPKSKQSEGKDSDKDEL